MRKAAREVRPNEAQGGEGHTGGTVPSETGVAGMRSRTKPVGDNGDKSSALDPRPVIAGLTLRAAEMRDCRRILAWANDPATRVNSFTSRPIGYAEHRCWFEAALASDQRWLYIAQVKQIPVGLVRLDQEYAGAEVAEVGINVAPRHRRKGLSDPILRQIRRIAGARGIHTLVARIRAENEVSIRVFERAGYRFVAEEKTQTGLARRYEAVVQIV